MHLMYFIINLGIYLTDEVFTQREDLKLSEVYEYLIFGNIINCILSLMVEYLKHVCDVNRMKGLIYKYDCSYVC